MPKVNKYIIIGQGIYSVLSIFFKNSVLLVKYDEIYTAERGFFIK